jgi:putative transposase
LAGGLYHVGAEGNDGRAIVVDWSDCARWTSLLETAQRRFRWIAHAYCLMITHFHLLVETPEPNLSDGMHWLNHVYAKTFNRRHGRPMGHASSAPTSIRAVVAQGARLAAQAAAAA